MSNTFKFADKFNFTPPFDFKTFEKEEFDAYKEKVILNQKTVKSGIIWVDDEADFQKTFGLIKDDPNKFRVFAELKKGKKKQKGEFKKLNDSGISFSDIKKIHGITLGVNLVKAIESENKKENTKIIIEDLFKWLGIRKSREEKTYSQLENHIHVFVKKHPSEVFEPEKVYEELFQLLQECISLGVIGVSDIAKFLSEEVFNTLASQIKKLKLEENKWNPESKDKGGTSNYDPLFNDFSEVEKGVAFIFDKLTSFKVQYTEHEKVNSIIDLLKHSVIRIFNRLKEIILTPIQELNDYIRKNNAYIVGFINGIIDAVASIVEGIGFVIGLFNYDNLRVFISAIQKLLNDFDWSIIQQFIKKELQKLFAFWTEEDQYKQIYEFGTFIPRLFEIAVSLITGAKATQKVAKSLVEIIKDMPKQSQELKKALIQLKNKAVFDVDTQVLKTLKSKGVTISFELSFDKLFSGIPEAVVVKALNSRVFRVDFKGYPLKKFKNKKDLDSYIKRLENDPQFFDNELAQGIKRYRNRFRSESPNFKKIDEWFAINRAKFMISDELDVPKIKKLWATNNKIVKKELTGEKLHKLTKIYETLDNRNIATTKLEVEVNGKIQVLKYIENSGKGTKVTGSKGHASGRKIKDTEFTDPEFDMKRINDSESKIIELMNEDIAKIIDDLGIPINNLKVKVSMDTTYDPCNVCKKELLLFQEQFNADLEVFRPFFIDKDGVKKLVTKGEQFIKIN